MDNLRIEIKSCLEKDLPLVEKNLMSKFHRLRFDVQENGEGIYLIAWFEGVPVGNMLIRWNGSVNSYIVQNKVVMPYLEALLVNEQYRRQGVGTQLIQFAEKLIIEKGFDEVGLAVGIKNTNARRLYESLGFKLYPKLNEFLVTRVYKNEGGLTVEEREPCVYLHKKLN